MKPSSLLWLTVLLVSQGLSVFPLTAYADSQAEARALIREQHDEQAQELRTVLRCCRCTKPNTEAFCVKLTGATSCGAYRESSNFQSLPRENQNTLTDYACSPQGDPTNDTACNPGTSPTPPTATPPVTPTPPTTPATDTSCPHTFADFTAVAADIRPISRPLPPDPNPFVSITPTLGVQIPGLVFSPARREGNLVYVPFLAQYIAAVERYAVGLALVAAIIMIVYGGFRYLLGSAFGDIATGKQIVLNAILGLLLALGAYMILNTINPNTLEMPELKLGYIEPSYYGEGEGANEPIRIGGGTSCRCSPIPQGINEASVLKVPCYRQYDSTWGALPFGANLLPAGETMNCSAQNISYSATLPACSGSATQNSSCQGTLGQGGCGPSSLAVVMAYYGVQSNGHLVTPFDTAQYIVRSCRRPLNGGTSDVCSSRFSQEYPGFTCIDQRGGNKAERAAQEIRAGHPVIFHCAKCNVTKGSGNIASGSVGAGHYMVLTGVNVTGNIFSVHDVGHEGATAAVAISGDEINENRRVTAIYIIRPTTQVATPTAAPRCTATGGGRRWGGSGGTQSVESWPFTYCPGRGEGTCTRGWDPNKAWIMYPTRLLTAEHPQIRLYIYIHGNNHDVDSTTDNHTRLLRNSLQKALTNKDIVIAAPHWYGDDDTYMHGFDLQKFYTKAVAAIRVKMPRATITDIVVGGHSAATCSGTLKQALRNNHPVLTPARGFVVYDGCESDGDMSIYGIRRARDGSVESPFLYPSVNGQNFAPHGVALIVGPDAVGMGIESSLSDPVTHTPPRDRISASRRSWGFNSTPMTHCPPSVPMGGVDCYSHPTETTHNNEWAEIVTHQDHASNVETITDIAFRAFYGSN